MWSAEQVARAAEDWVWVPVDASDETTPDYRVTVYPDWVSLSRVRTTRPFQDVLAEVRARATATDRPVLRWWVTPGSAPPDTVDQLVAHGFTPVETLDVFALDLTEPGVVAQLVERLAVPDDVTVRRVCDEDGTRLAGNLAAEVFGQSPPTPAQVVEELAGLDTEPGPWRSRRYLGLLDGEPVGSAGATRVDDVVRLWGGAVLDGHRGRGAYRAMLAARCRDAAEAGARLVLVKGRVATSGPVLRRAGFEVHGQERCLELRLR